MANGDIKYLKWVVGSISVVLIAGWLCWISIGAIAADKRISVTESVVSYIQTDIKEVKELVKEIRQDQVRRERVENGRHK
jgi:hypothetical protein